MGGGCIVAPVLMCQLCAPHCCRPPLNPPCSSPPPPLPPPSLPPARSVVLAKLLAGGILRADPAAMREWEAIQGQFKPPEDFRMKVVDVNRTCKGTRTGGLYRYRCDERRWVSAAGGGGSA